jgi:hypothetical protein
LYHRHSVVPWYCTLGGMFWNFDHSSVLLWFVWDAEGVPICVCVCVCDKMKETQPTSLLLQSRFPFIRTSPTPLVLIHHPFPVSLLLFTHINPRSRLFPHLTLQHNWSAVLLSARTPSTCPSICLLVQSSYAINRLYQLNSTYTQFIDIPCNLNKLSFSSSHCALRLVSAFVSLASQKDKIDVRNTAVISGSLPPRHDTFSGYGGYLRIYWIISRGQPTRGGTPVWRLGEEQTISHR